MIKMYIYLIQWSNCKSNSYGKPVSLRLYNDFESIEKRFISDIIKYCDKNIDEDKKHICKLCEDYIKNIPKKGRTFKTDCVELTFEEISDNELFNKDFHFF